MGTSETNTPFKVRELVEQTPFEDNPPLQNFFRKWCDINDHIRPLFVDRDEWDSGQVLTDATTGGKKLLVPKDVKLWEMANIMAAVDRDTFVDKPERQTHAKEGIVKLGETLRDTGVYIAQRRGAIGEGREAAEELATEFYTYGQALATGTAPPERASLDDIANKHLSTEATDDVDRFLAGEKLHQKRRAEALADAEKTASPAEDSVENMRRKTLAQLFRVAHKSTQLSAESDALSSNAKLEPWQSDTSVHDAFLEKLQASVKHAIETPQHELHNSIFRRGMELLASTMPFDKLPETAKDAYLHWKNGEKTLREALQIDRLKAELAAIRKTGDITAISNKEREVADTIQKAVGSYEYKDHASHPSYIALTQQMNCVGFSTLAGALFEEAGLQYLSGDVPGHSILFLLTARGYVEWRDIQRQKDNTILSDNMLEGGTIQDILDLNSHPAPKGLMINMVDSKYHTKMVPSAGKGQGRYILVQAPQIGLAAQILGNMGAVLADMHLHKEAAAAIEQAVVFNPSDPYLYDTLGIIFYNTGHDREAIQAYRMAITKDPKLADSYYGLGHALQRSGDTTGAIHAFQRSLELADPKANEDIIENASRILKELRPKKDSKWPWRLRKK